MLERYRQMAKPAVPIESPRRREIPLIPQPFPERKPIPDQIPNKPISPKPLSLPSPRVPVPAGR